MILAFDFGVKNIGVAASSTPLSTPEELPAIPANNGIPQWQHIDDLIAQWQPTKLVVGLPLNMDGTEQEMTKRARKFGNRLNNRYQLTLVFIDERLSTREAKERAFERGHHGHFASKPIDSIAAAVLLEHFWNTQPDTP